MGNHCLLVFTLRNRPQIRWVSWARRWTDFVPRLLGPAPFQPGKAFYLPLSIYLPHLTLPHHTFPHLTSPCLTTPYLTLPHHTLPDLTSPCLPALPTCRYLETSFRLPNSARISAARFGPLLAWGGLPSWSRLKILRPTGPQRSRTICDLIGAVTAPGEHVLMVFRKFPEICSEFRKNSRKSPGKRLEVRDLHKKSRDGTGRTPRIAGIPWLVGKGGSKGKPHWRVEELVGSLIWIKSHQRSSRHQLISVHLKTNSEKRETHNLLNLSSKAILQ